MGAQFTMDVFNFFVHQTFVKQPCHLGTVVRYSPGSGYLRSNRTDPSGVWQGLTEVCHGKMGEEHFYFLGSGKGFLEKETLPSDNKEL